MIAGFNTDIEFGGTVYHVQTEDKGAPHRMIMSLVYDRGTILASKRTTYTDLEPVDFDEHQIAEKVSRQHKLMCAAVRAGRINELVEMTRKNSAAIASTKAPVTSSVILTPAVEGPGESFVPKLPAAAVIEPSATLDVGIVEQLPVPSDTSPVQLTDDDFEGLPIIEAVEIIEDVEIIPAEAISVVSELSGKERVPNSRLTLELLGEQRLKGGDRKTINVMLCRGTSQKVVPGAQIMVKILGSSFRPVIFHAMSDVNGLAKVHLQLPHFSAGRAALLIRALAEGEEVELRKLVTPG